MLTGISREQEGQLASNYRLINEAIERACSKSGRNPDEITLVAVSKSVGPEVIAHACDLGIKVFGENRPQVLRQKAAWFASNRPDLVDIIEWHMIGHLQRNKAKLVLDNAALIHSVDSQRLAEKLNEISLERGVRSPILAQIKLSSEESKFGVQADSAEEFVRGLAALPGLNLSGLMGMASFIPDEMLIRKEFSRLKRIHAELNSYWSGSGILSMGMSSDFEWAIEEGATHVRVGSSLFRF